MSGYAGCPDHLPALVGNYVTIPGPERTSHDLRYVILPFNQFPLLTVKALDLKDFIAALEIKGQFG